MKKKRLTALITSAVMSLGMLSSFPSPSVHADVTVIMDNFEVTYDGWTNSGDFTELTACSGAGYELSRGMSVTNRQTSDDGVFSEKGFYLDGGTAYDYSVYVYADSDETFSLSLRWLYPDSGTYESAQIASVTVKAGEWTEISARYTAPKGTENLTLTLTTDSTADFYFDEFSVTQSVKTNADRINAAADDVGLKDIYANKFLVGSVLNSGTVNNNTITAMILKEFNSITCENEMKPNATLTANGSTNTDIKVSLSQAAKILDFCSKNNIGVRGHTLVWHGQTPTWFFMDNFTNSGTPVSKNVMEQRLESYIKNLFNAIKTQYPTLNLYAYDVVNEAVSDDSSRTSVSSGLNGARPGGFEQGVVAPGSTSGGSPWVYIYGDNSFIERAFTYAAKYRDQYHPNMKLFYNDYNEFWDHKRDCIIRTIVKPLYEKGLLDGMGMQSHLNASTNANDFGGINAFNTAANMYAEIGCEVQFTELDVSTDNGKFTSQQQADRYKSIFQTAMDINKKGKGKVTAICVWGPNDANTWIGSENTPLLFDANTQKKAAYNTVAALVPQSEWGDGSNPGGPGADVPVEPNEWGWYYHCEFEGDTENWTGRGSAVISTSARTSYHGSEALLVSDRTASWNGVSRALNANPFKPGSAFSFSTNAIYLDGEATDVFFMKLQYTDASGETNYSTIAEVTAIKGEWFQLSNTNYVIPADAENMQIYIETAESTNNFYIDEAIGAVGGVTILGAGVPEITVTTTAPTTTSATSKTLLGDVNCDGKVSISDLILLAKYIGSKAKLSEQGMINARCNDDAIINGEDLLILIKFLAGEIEFTKQNPAEVDTAKMEQLFASITPASSLKTAGNGNPLMTQRFSADPGYLVYKDRLYIYSTNDVIEYETDGSIKENSYGQIDKINCMSSADLVNWTDHGAIPAAGKNGIAKFASQSWAPCATWKTIDGKDKFFLYFCNNASGIVVLTADSPTGPWSDPLGKALINPWGTVGVDKPAGCDGVVWWFDPAVFVDDDGTGYLYFGGGIPDGKEANPQTARVVKLGDNMISTVGSAAMIDAPYLFEDSGINKIGNTYYYSYCSNFSTGNYAQTGFRGGVIQYMTSSSPMGPFTYQGEVFRNPSEFFSKDGGNNHHSILEFKGQYYMLYHARQVQNAMGITGNYRSTQIDKLTVGTDGKFQLVQGTMKGIAQLETLNPYNTVRAATISRQAGINVREVGNTIVTDINKGDWVSVTGAEFTKGASSVTVRVSATKACAIKICTGSPTGKAVGYVDIPATDGFTDITAPISGLTGAQDLYFVFSDTLEFESWSFK